MEQDGDIGDLKPTGFLVVKELQALNLLGKDIHSSGEKYAEFRRHISRVQAKITEEECGRCLAHTRYYFRS
jgi:hypothetical protein